MHVQGHQRISVSPAPQWCSLVSQPLDGNEYSDSISDLLDTHLLQDLLVTFEKIVTIEVVRSKQLLVLSASYRVQPIADVLLVPRSDRIQSVIDLGEL